MNHKPEDVKAAEEAERMFAEDQICQAFLAGCEHKQKEMQWISVEERLPEDGQTVAFVVKSDDLRDGFVYGGKYSYGDFCTPGVGFAASHWMPLPEPPNTDHNYEKPFVTN